MAQLQGKVAVITGGTSGIGLAAAKLFLEKGIRVALVGRNVQKGREALELLQKFSERCAFVQGDVVKVKDCEKIVQEVLVRFGALDILVNSAGVYLEKAISEVTEEDFDAVMNVNIKGTYFMCKAAIPALQRSAKGAIVNVSSDAGINGNRFCSVYCASKGAVNLFTKALALEISPYNIRVNSVCPGDVDTPLTRRQINASGNPEEYLQDMKNLYPLGRIGEAQEVAEVICFLASDQAGFVTGSTWTVDGGLTAY